MLLTSCNGKRLNSAYFAELSLPLQATLEQRRTDFMVRIRSGFWWVRRSTIVTISFPSPLSTRRMGPGQVGGVY